MDVEIPENTQTQMIFLIPHGEHGLPGPLCRVLREEGDRYYISLDHAEDSRDNRRGIRPSGGRNNLWVRKTDVIAIGTHVDLALQKKVAKALVDFEVAVTKKAAEDSQAYLILKAQRHKVVQAILAGEEAVFPRVKVLPAGNETERLRCATMAGRIDALGAEFKEIADYLRERSGQYDL